MNNHKTLFLLLLIYIPILGNSQSNTDQETSFILGFNYSPNYSYHTLKYEDDFQFAANGRKMHEKASFGYNTGIDLTYQFKPKVKINLGLQYAVQGNWLRNIPIDTTLGGTSGFVDVKYTYEYLEIPIRVKYEIVKKTIRFNAIIGGSLNFFQGSHSQIHFMYDNGAKEEMDGNVIYTNPNKLVYAGILSFGIEHELTNRSLLNFEPIFRYSFKPVENAAIKQFNYSLGIQMGIQIRLIR